MDDLDRAILAELRRDSRVSISSLATQLKVARATVQHRITRMENNGTITGYTISVNPENSMRSVKAIMSIATEGSTANLVISRLKGFASVAGIHSTNGKWDLIVEIQANTLEEFDNTINLIRKMREISSSETNLLLSTY